MVSLACIEGLYLVLAGLAPVVPSSSERISTFRIFLRPSDLELDGQALKLACPVSSAGCPQCHPRCWRDGRYDVYGTCPVPIAGERHRYFTLPTIPDARRNEDQALDPGIEKYPPPRRQLIYQRAKPQILSVLLHTRTTRERPIKDLPTTLVDARTLWPNSESRIECTLLP